MLLCQSTWSYPGPSAGGPIAAGLAATGQGLIHSKARPVVAGVVVVALVVVGVAVVVLVVVVAHQKPVSPFLGSALVTVHQEQIHW